MRTLQEFFQRRRVKVLREGDDVAINGGEIRTASFQHCNVDGATMVAGEKIRELAFGDGSAGIYQVPVLGTR